MSSVALRLQPNRIAIANCALHLQPAVAVGNVSRERRLVLGVLLQLLLHIRQLLLLGLDLLAHIRQLLLPLILQPDESIESKCLMPRPLHVPGFIKGRRPSHA